MEKLTFTMQEIPPEGLAFELAPDPAVFGIGEVSVVNPPGLSGWLKIVKERSDLLVSGDVRAVIEVPCNRCLRPARCAVGGEFSFRMAARAASPGDEETELAAGDLDVEFFDGETVDVRAIVAEQVYLNVPIRELCRPDCRGLCPTCGQDLNAADCGHPRDAADPRWASLRTLHERDTD